MNYNNFVKQCKIFGNNFVIVKSNSDNADYKSMVVEIAGEMDKQGCNYVIRSEDLYQNNFQLLLHFLEY